VIRRRAAAFAALALPAVCSASAPHDRKLAPASPKAVLAFGLAPTAPNIVMTIGRLDPATCRWTGKSRRYQRTPFPFVANRRSFIVDSLDPGYYAILSVRQVGGFMVFNWTNENGADAFELKGGHVNYIGDIRLTPNRAELQAYDDAALREHLKSLPRVAEEPVRVAPFRTTFSYKEGATRIPGCAIPAAQP
jgi:hypothetical protein